MAGRWAIFVHDPDGDMGYGRIVGPFYSDAVLPSSTGVKHVIAIR
jgi:hypothetical protein